MAGNPPEVFRRSEGRIGEAWSLMRTEPGSGVGVGWVGLKESCLAPDAIIAFMVSAELVGVWDV